MSTFFINSLVKLGASLIRQNVESCMAAIYQHLAVYAMLDDYIMP